ncbi:hypothetical protein NK718_09650 [Alsobacter sp. SYSU M60028]|uniref:Lectin-like protein BA14k n=1 Tax=Alsobacter ponti TaxID=2962936 RepID=A0ABT1LBB1_9HYPH|nr:hypothetical protein [Alsobacter ponti]MCP8938777.1 hypothetical protein [Alsobacter ponti]
MSPVFTANARKTLAAGLAAVTLAAGLMSGAPAAEAKDGRNAALFGGLAAGAVVGGAIASAARPAYGYGYTGSYYNDGYYAPTYRSYSPARSYYNGAYYNQETYMRQCWRERQPVYDAYGDVVAWRKVRVCN